MSDLARKPKTGKRSIFSAVILAGLLVGTLDITAAIFQTLFRDARPMRMFQFIASGVYGREAFSQVLPYALYGILFHYCIAFIWTGVFFITVRRIRSLLKHKFITGVVYGIVVWIIMNRLVLPLSNTPPIAFDWLSAMTGVLIIIAAIGLPLSWLTHCFFKTTS